MNEQRAIEHGSGLEESYKDTSLCKWYVDRTFFYIIHCKISLSVSAVWACVLHKETKQNVNV